MMQRDLLLTSALLSTALVPTTGCHSQHRDGRKEVMNSTNLVHESRRHSGNFGNGGSGNSGGSTSSQAWHFGDRQQSSTTFTPAPQYQAPPPPAVQQRPRLSERLPIAVKMEDKTLGCILQTSNGLVFLKTSTGYSGSSVEASFEMAGMGVGGEITSMSANNYMQLKYMEFLALFDYDMDKIMSRVHDQCSVRPESIYPHTVRETLQHLVTPNGERMNLGRTAPVYFKVDDCLLKAVQVSSSEIKFFKTAEGYGIEGGGIKAGASFSIDTATALAYYEISDFETSALLEKENISRFCDRAEIQEGIFTSSVDSRLLRYVLKDPKIYGRPQINHYTNSLPAPQEPAPQQGAPSPDSSNLAKLFNEALLPKVKEEPKKLPPPIVASKPRETEPAIRTTPHVKSYVPSYSAPRKITASDTTTSEDLKAPEKKDIVALKSSNSHEGELRERRFKSTEPAPVTTYTPRYSYSPSAFSPQDSKTAEAVIPQAKNVKFGREEFEGYVLDQRSRVVSKSIEWNGEYKSLLSNRPGSSVEVLRLEFNRAQESLITAEIERAERIALDLFKVQRIDDSQFEYAKKLFSNLRTEMKKELNDFCYKQARGIERLAQASNSSGAYVSKPVNGLMNISDNEQAALAGGFRPRFPGSRTTQSSVSRYANAQNNNTR